MEATMADNDTTLRSPSFVPGRQQTATILSTLLAAIKVLPNCSEGGGGVAR